MISFDKTFLQGVRACPFILVLIVIIKIVVKLPQSHSKSSSFYEHNPKCGAWIHSGDH